MGAQGRPQHDNPQSEQALILKALAARGNEFHGTDTGDRAMREITAFAGDIRGLSQQELVRQTTTLDLERGHGLDIFGQLNNRTCVPASAQITRAEADPIYALYLTNPRNRTEIRNGRLNYFKPPVQMVLMPSRTRSNMPLS